MEKAAASIPRQHHSGAWIQLDHIDLGEGADTFEILAASVDHGREIKLRLNPPDGELIGTQVLAGNGKKNQWICPLFEPGNTMKPSAVRRARPAYALLETDRGKGSLARLD